MQPHGPAWERQGARSAHPRPLRPLPAGPGPGHHGRCCGWWSPVPGGSFPLMGEPGCDWRERQGAPVGCPSCGQRRMGQGGAPRQASALVPVSFFFLLSFVVPRTCHVSYASGLCSVESLHPTQAEAQKLGCHVRFSRQCTAESHHHFIDSASFRVTSYLNYPFFKFAHSKLSPIPTLLSPTQQLNRFTCIFGGLSLYSPNLKSQISLTKILLS